jgi:hypothetical protein
MSWKAWFASWFRRVASPIATPSDVVVVEPVVDKVTAAKAAVAGVMNLMDRAIEIVASLDRGLKDELRSSPNNRTAIMAAVLENGGDLKDAAFVQDAALLTNKIHVLSVGETVFQVAVFILARFAPVGTGRSDLELAVQWAYRSYQLLRQMQSAK